jgi:hypothetical protein
VSTVFFPVLLLVVSGASPAPSPTTLKTIIRVHSSPLCTTVESNALYEIEGLHANDRLIESSKPLLISMGKEFEPNGIEGQIADKQQRRWGNAPGDTHETNPGLLRDNQHLRKLTGEIIYNLAIIDSVLSDPHRFPAIAKTDDNETSQLLKSLLEATAEEQRQNLNVLYGLVDTFSLQDLIAKGDGTQGVINDPGAKAQVSHNDQYVSFRDVLTGPQRGRIGHPVDPTVDQDPAVSQAGSDLANNPIARFYTRVTEIQQSTSRAEDALSQTVLSVVASCQQ